MAGLKQIMEIFMTINQPLSSEQRVRWYIQRKHSHANGYFTFRKMTIFYVKPFAILFHIFIFSMPKKCDG